MKRGLWIIPALIIAGCSSDSSKATDILNSVKDANIQEIIKVALPEEIKSNPAMEYIQNAMDKNQNEIIKNIYRQSKSGKRHDVRGGAGGTE